MDAQSDDAESSAAFPVAVRYLTAPEIRKRYNGIAKATLERWLERDEFPRPIRIGRKRFWRSDELEEFERSRAG